MINSQSTVIIARLEFEIAEYRQELRDCKHTEKAKISHLKMSVENANEKLSRYLAV